MIIHCIVLLSPGGGIGRRACFRCMLPQAVEVRVFFRAPIKKSLPCGEIFLLVSVKARTSNRKFDHKRKAYGSMPVANRRCVQGRPRHLCRRSVFFTKRSFVKSHNISPVWRDFFIGIRKGENFQQEVL